MTADPRSRWGMIAAGIEIVHDSKRRIRLRADAEEALMRGARMAEEVTVSGAFLADLCEALIASMPGDAQEHGGAAMTPAIARIANAFAPLFARADVTALPFGRFDVLVTVAPWMDAAKVEAVVSLGLFACAPDVGIRVRAHRMPWAELAARVLFVAVLVGCLLLMTYGGC